MSKLQESIPTVVKHYSQVGVHLLSGSSMDCHSLAFQVASGPREGLSKVFYIGTTHPERIYRQTLVPFCKVEAPYQLVVPYQEALVKAVGESWPNLVVFDMGVLPNLGLSMAVKEAMDESIKDCSYLIIGNQVIHLAFPDTFDEVARDYNVPIIRIYQTFSANPYWDEADLAKATTCARLRFHTGPSRMRLDASKGFDGDIPLVYGHDPFFFSE